MVFTRNVLCVHTEGREEVTGYTRRGGGGGKKNNVRCEGKERSVMTDTSDLVWPTVTLTLMNLWRATAVTSDGTRFPIFRGMQSITRETGRESWMASGTIASEE